MVKNHNHDQRTSIWRFYNISTKRPQTTPICTQTPPGCWIMHKRTKPRGAKATNKKKKARVGCSVLKLNWTRKSLTQPTQLKVKLLKASWMMDAGCWMLDACPLACCGASSIQHQQVENHDQTTSIWRFCNISTKGPQTTPTCNQSPLGCYMMHITTNPGCLGCCKIKKSRVGCSVLKLNQPRKSST